MFFVILAALAVLGGSAYVVLNQRTSRNPRRNATTSRFLLGASGLMIAAGLVAGLAGLIRS